MRAGRIVVFAALAALAGCAHLSEMLGLSMDLRHQRVESIAAHVEGQAALCPGMSAPLVVTAMLDGGKTVATEGAGGGKVVWDSFEFTSATARVEDGKVVVAADPRLTFAKEAELAIQVAGQPEHRTRVTIPIRYDCAYLADYSGEPGDAGSDGAPGRSGADGRDEMSTGDEARAGGNGQNGGQGGDGHDGRGGRDADDLEVKVSLARARPPLLAVEVHPGHHGSDRLFLVDPHGGHLEVRANGGAGGRGGHGGRGGDGGHGGTGAPNGDGGDAGDGGNGGDGGDGADGGRIEVDVAPAAKRFVSVIAFANSGGRGGEPGEAGFGGSGGITYSGGRQGRDGSVGRAGQRRGRDGRPGPRPIFRSREVALKL